MASSRSKAGAANKLLNCSGNGRQELLEGNPSIVCLPVHVLKIFLTVDVIWIVNHRFLSFYRVPRTNMLFKTYIQWAYLCFALSLSGFATSFIWHKWFAYIDSSSIHDHELSFKKAEYCESSCTECVYVPSYINWAIMIILYISFGFFLL